MITTAVDEIKTVWVTWTNTDLTEGRGSEFPLHAAESLETAERLGRRGGVQGSDCRITQERAFRINHRWFVPGKIIPESGADTAKRLAREAKEAILAKAKTAGLSEEEIEILRRG